MELQETKANKKRFFFLWILCILGAVSVFPYMRYLGMLPATSSAWKMPLFYITQSVLFFGFICWSSFKILHKIDLKPFALRNPLKQIVYPALIWGTLVGFTLFIFDKALFSDSLFSEPRAPLWARALASIYGGVNEEVLVRFFLFSLLYFLLGKCVRIHSGNRLFILWAINISAALLFGIGHLPTAFKLTAPSTFEIYRILLLNGVAGAVFGWLYWSRGLWAAMGAHLIADLVIHVFLVSTGK